MNPPAAVVLDLGKVLLDFDYGIAVRELALHSRLTPQEIQRLLLHTPLLGDYESGRLSSYQFFQAFRDQAGYSEPYEVFRRSFGEIFSPIEPMIALQQALKRHGVPTFLFSNTNEIAIDHIRRRFPFVEGFTAAVLSFEVGGMKPDAPIYEVVERVTGRAGPDLIYLDDRPENIDTALGRKWRGVVHQDPALSRAALRDAGLPVD